MPDRVGEHAKAGLSRRRQTTRAESHDGALRGVHIVDPDVEMELLGVLGIWPARRYPCPDALEGELTGAGLDADDDPVLVVLVDTHAEHLGVERGQRPRIRTIDHRLFQPTNHADII